MRVPMRVRAVALAAGLVLALGGCVEAEVVQRQPEVPDDGLQATGRIDGSRLAISAGGPTVTLGDCDPGGELDRDLCLATRTIGGISANLVIENPAALEADTTLEVADDPCGDAACDDVTDHAVVDLRLGREDLRAIGGTLTVDQTSPRWVVRFELHFPRGGRLSGRFNVRPGAGA